MKRLNKGDNEFFKYFVDTINGENDQELYEDKDARKVDWVAYNSSKIKDIPETIDFINKEVRKTTFLRAFKKVGRKGVSIRILTKIVLVCEKFGLDERDAEGFLQVFGKCLGIPKVDDRIVGRAYDNPEVAYILYDIFNRTKECDGKLAGDGSGIESTRKQNYGANKKSTKYFLTSIVDTTEIVQAFDCSGKDEGRAMHELVNEVNGDSLCLDAGFNDRKLASKIMQKGIIPYIYPKRSNLINGEDSWRLMYLELIMDLIIWLREYHLRSHSESFHSAFKRKFGIITKINPHSRMIQMLARIILHNRFRVRYSKSRKS
jgi:transposase